MAAACDEIWEAVQRFRSERSERMRLERLLRWTDRLLDEFERLNLDEVPRLPQTSRSRLVVLFSNLPFEFTAAMGASPTPTEALDAILDLQQQILRRKSAVKVTDFGDDGDIDGGCEPG